MTYSFELIHLLHVIIETSKFNIFKWIKYFSNEDILKKYGWMDR